MKGWRGWHLKNAGNIHRFMFHKNISPRYRDSPQRNQVSPNHQRQNPPPPQYYTDQPLPPVQHVESNFRFTHNDIEANIKKFSGDDMTNVVNWIEHFERQAVLYKWTELEKLIFVQRSTTGTAKDVLITESPSNYETAKQILFEEFDRRRSSAEVHRELTNIKKKSDESFISYVSRGKEIGQEADVDVTSLIQYLINGIHDIHSNKVILYGAHNLREFKDKLRIYEEFKRNSSINQKKEFPQKPKATEKKDDKESNLKTCDYCHSKGHTIDECRTKNAKCYKCNETGHRANKCKQTLTGTIIARPKTSSHIDLKFDYSDTDVVALFDSGSHINLVQESVFQMIENKVTKDPSILMIQGIGNRIITTKGKFQSTIYIDGERFETVFNITKDGDIPEQVILGREFLKATDVNISQNGLKFKKILPETEINVNEFTLVMNELTKIDTPKSTDIEAPKTIID